MIQGTPSSSQILMNLDFLGTLDHTDPSMRGLKECRLASIIQPAQSFAQGMRKEQKLAQQYQHFKAAHQKQLCQQVPDRLLSHANLSQRATQNLSLNSTPNTLNSCCKNICLAHSRLPTPNPHGLPSHPGFPGSHTRTCFLQKCKG